MEKAKTWTSEWWMQQKQEAIKINPSRVPMLMERKPQLPDAACKEKNLEIFFSNDKTEKARKICEGCPDKEPCLIYAMERNEFGFWGGKTKEERRLKKIQMLRQARKRVIKTK